MMFPPARLAPLGASALAVLLFLAVAGQALPVSAQPVPAQAQKAAPAAKPKAATSPLSGFGSGSKDPYKIDANRLEVQQKDNAATYSGDVVVVQGKMTMRCANKLVIFFDQKSSDSKTQALKGGAATPAAAQSAPADKGGASGLKRLECHGPVSITQEKQTATGNLLVYENDAVTMTGSVVMSDGDNVQAGEKLVYNTKTGIGTVEGGRVRGIFIPGQGDPGKPKAGEAPKPR